MALGISSLDVRCRVSPRERPLALAAHDWLRERFATELAAHLGPSLDRLDGLTVLRWLDVRVRVRGGDLSAGTLLDACSRAFGESLFRALVGAGDADSCRRFADPLDHGVARIRWLLSSDAADGWIFVDDQRGNVGGGTSSSVAEATLALVLDARRDISPLLARLRAANLLERLLAIWDEYAIERIFVAHARHTAADA